MEFDLIEYSETILNFANGFHPALGVVLSEANESNFGESSRKIFNIVAQSRGWVHKCFDDSYWVPSIFSFPFVRKLVLNVGVSGLKATFGASLEQ